jgi:hypothetical protein
MVRRRGLLRLGAVLPGNPGKSTGQTREKRRIEERCAVNGHTCGISALVFAPAERFKWSESKDALGPAKF